MFVAVVGVCVVLLFVVAYFAVDAAVCLFCFRCECFAPLRLFWLLVCLFVLLMMCVFVLFCCVASVWVAALRSLVLFCCFSSPCVARVCVVLLFLFVCVVRRVCLFGRSLG